MINKKKALIILIIAEIIYVVISTFLSFSPDVLMGEVFRNIARVFSIIILSYFYFLYFKDSFKAKKENRSHLILYLLSLVALFLFPITIKTDGLEGNSTKILFALTSFIVGVREELFYRAIVQNSLSKKMKKFGSVILTSIFFTFYHLSYFINLDFIAIVEAFLVGIVIGVIYYNMRSLLMVIMIHSFYDVLWSFVPIIPFLPDYVAIVLLIISVSLIILWDFLENRK